MFLSNAFTYTSLSPSIISSQLFLICSRRRSSSVNEIVVTSSALRGGVGVLGIEVLDVGDLGLGKGSGEVVSIRRDRERIVKDTSW